MITEVNKSKIFPIEELRNSIVHLSGIIDNDCNTLSKAKRKHLEAALAEVVACFNIARSVTKLKKSKAKWIPSRIPGHWPETEDSPWKPVDYSRYSKPMLDSDDEMPRRVNK